MPPATPDRCTCPACGRTFATMALVAGKVPAHRWDRPQGMLRRTADCSGSGEPPSPA